MLAIIAIALMWFDHHYSAFHHLRNRLTFATTTPIHTAIQAPFRWISHLNTGVESHHHLVKTNQRLEKKTLQLEEELHQLTPLQQENQQLRSLLTAKQHYELKAIAVEVIAMNINRFAQQLIINRGSRNGVVVGQPIVDGRGIVGQVVQVASSHSRVMLISDKNSRVPVEDSRNGFEAIAVGNGIVNSLTLPNVTHSAGVQVGDRLISSGLGQRYPQGYPVAVITKVEYHHNDQTVTVNAKPLADLTTSRELLLLSPTQPSLHMFPDNNRDEIKKAVLKQLTPATLETGSNQSHQEGNGHAL